ncbi:MAG: phosphonoacetaldehyde hydrolase [Bryobacterales bacterium]|jgi:phosphonoacetaldehyde hydrolase|nr:phosphonoacetaldehyde hydrolase [Bryobacterales bacterium]
MSFRFQRKYTGPVQAVIFDWAGTTLDYGCRAPVAAFQRLFEEESIRVSVDEARRPMGAHKRDHIAMMLAMESIAAQWREIHGANATHEDIERLYQKSIPMQADIVLEYAKLTPFVLPTMEMLAERDILVGSTTGYSRRIMEGLIQLAADQGYHPESVVCADEVPEGRPAPWMAITSAMHMNAYPLESCVKIGDTVADIEEGLNAGMWTVGVSLTGNELGLTEEEVDTMDEDQLDLALLRADRKFKAAGAHYVLETLEHLESVLDDIEERLATGERP